MERATFWRLVVFMRSKHGDAMRGGRMLPEHLPLEVLQVRPTVGRHRGDSQERL